MKKIYFSPSMRIVSVLPERIIALSTPGAHPGEDDDERAPQSSRRFDWGPEYEQDNYWKQ